MFRVDVLSRIPVYEQLINQIERFLLNKVLGPGDKLPSVRQLSIELGVNPNTITKAYGVMEQKGLTVSVQGRGVYISQDAVKIIQQKVRDREKDLVVLVKELKLSGMEKEELLNVVVAAYEKEEV